MTIKEISWLAGLLEGEGCFSPANGTVTISVGLADLDVMQRVCALFGNSTLYKPKRRSPKHKQLYYTSIHGKRAAAWMMTLYSLLGSRRRAKIVEGLKLWLPKKAVRNDGLCPRCGVSQRAVQATGLRVGKLLRYCQPCNKEYCLDYYVKQSLARA